MGLPSRAPPPFLKESQSLVKSEYEGTPYEVRNDISTHNGKMQKSRQGACSSLSASATEKRQSPSIVGWIGVPSPAQGIEWIHSVTYQPCVSRDTCLLPSGDGLPTHPARISPMSATRFTVRPKAALVASWFYTSKIDPDGNGPTSWMVWKLEKRNAVSV